MRIINSFIALFIVFLMSSCTDWLTEEPKSSITGDIHFSNYGGLSDGLTGAYSKLRRIYGYQEGFMLTTPGTDIFTHGDQGGQDMDTYDSRLNPQLGNFRNVWNHSYEAINLCNAVIERSAYIEDATTEQLDIMKGEAIFLRSLFYWWLTQQWGDIPFRIKETKEISTEATREPVENILNQLAEDLMWAIDILPVHSSQEEGRATKGAAMHLLSKIHLIIGFKYDATSYIEAERISRELIESGEYSLLPYEDIFDYNNQRNSEIVFAVQYSTNPLFNGTGNRGHVFFTPVYDIFPGLMRDVTQGGRPYSRFAPTKFFRELFDENDSRFDVTFRTEWYYNTTSGLPEGKNLGDIVEWTYADGSVSTIAPNEGRMHWGIKKHDDPTRASFQDLNGFRDYFVFRMGETYLILAEALYQQGKIAEAAEILNKLRSMRSKEGTFLPVVEKSDVDLDYILDERARELGGEMHRWMDLVRTDKLLERVYLYNATATQHIQEYHCLRPIPQTELDLVTTVGYNQNPGYPLN